MCGNKLTDDDLKIDDDEIISEPEPKEDINPEEIKRLIASDEIELL